jgi:Flp pilus assembly protein TadB
MNLDDAKALWSSDNEPMRDDMSAQTLSNADIVRLVKKQSDAFDQKIRRRDLLESVAAVAVFLFFGWLAWHDPSWLVRSGALIVMGGSTLIFWRLRRARTHFANASMDQPIKQMLRQERAKVDAQIHLLESILWWYIAPLVVGLLLVTVGDNGWSTFTFVYGTIVLLGSAVIYALNQRAVRRSLRPRREELTRLLDQVKEHVGS